MRVAPRPRVFLAMIAQALVSSNDEVDHSATTFSERSCNFDMRALRTSSSIVELASESGASGCVKPSSVVAKAALPKRLTNSIWAVAPEAWLSAQQRFGSRFGISQSGRMPISSW